MSGLDLETASERSGRVEILSNKIMKYTMKYRNFGKLDFKPSALGFGAMRLPVIGEDRSRIDEKKATRVIYYAIDHGVNYLDTAYMYHGSQSEPFLGKILTQKDRKKVKIATKLPTGMVETKKDFDQLLNEQLKRLKTDHIDFYLLHGLNKTRWDKVYKLGVLPWLEKIKKEGKIGHFGFSFHDDYNVLKKIVNAYDWTFCQIQYNILDINYQAGVQGLKYAAKRGLAVVIMEPLKGGKLANPPETIKKIWEKAPEKTPVEWALQWLWNQPQVSLVLSGMSTLQQVKENVESANSSAPNSLNKKDLSLIEKVRKKYEQLTPIPCTKCEYCLSCPQGVNIPQIFEIYNSVNTFNTPLEEARKRYRRLVDEEKAVNCVKCGQCEAACPQKIKITKWLKKADKLLGEA